jgi:outer membrane receptor protein involved in Fe transport
VRGLLAILFLLPAPVPAADNDGYVGRLVAQVIDSFREQGYPFAYSTNLVTGDLVVGVEPNANEPLAIVRQILEPHGLTVRVESGVYLVVRNPAPAAPVAGPPAQPRPPAIEEISVSASRYMIASDVSTSRFSIDQQTIEATPDLGDDPLRVVQRLPGAAASGASARTHFRGGEESEIGIMLNGQRLFDPFHVRDFQNIFSSIDSRAIEGVEVYTGGFPVHYGDRMSGMILMDSLQAPAEPHSEVGLSFYNTSFLTTGSATDTHWLLSARRGNLDLVINPRYGSPSFADLFGRAGIELSPEMSVALNVLYADDNVDIVLEPDPEDRQEVSSDTRNFQVWLEADNTWSDRLTSRTVLSAVLFDNQRYGSIDDVESIVGSVTDDREATQLGFRQDFRYMASERHRLEWGLEARRSEAQYAYRNHADYYELSAMYAGRPDTLDTVVDVAPEGASYALYFADRWTLGDATLLEWGLRWDDQTYTGLLSDAQLSPRLSLMREIGEHTEVRFSWGRYHQVQDIHELQVEDDIAEFWPAQSADHLIAGLRHHFDDMHTLRIEAFHKSMHDVRPRFENLFNPLGAIPEIQPDRVRLDPAGATARGVEVSVSREGTNTDWWAMYTWANVVDRIDGRDEPRSWNQQHALQIGMHWGNERWDFSVATGAHAGWPTTDLALVEAGTDEDGETEYVAIPGPRNAEQYGVFASLDLRIARTWKLGAGSLMTFLEVSNLTNRRNECCLDWDLEDTDTSGEEWLERDVEYWMPLLPAIGVLWEF